MMTARCAALSGAAFWSAAVLGLAATAFPPAAHARIATTLSAGNPGLSIAQAISNADRPKADQARDADRKPAALLAFAGVRRGMAIADVMPGQGYFTRLFANAVGPTGHVWAVEPAWLLEKHPGALTPMNALAQQPAFANVSVVTRKLDALALPRKVDMVWTSQNYHDLYYGQSPDAALAFDKAVFAALKPGGIFMVIDHVAAPGATGDLASLHRIDPALIRQQAEAAGFVFQAESKALANPSDPHDKPVFDPSIRGRTDQAILKFRKPAR